MRTGSCLEGRSGEEITCPPASKTNPWLSNDACSQSGTALLGRTAISACRRLHCSHCWVRRSSKLASFCWRCLRLVIFLSFSQSDPGRYPLVLGDLSRRREGDPNFEMLAGL